VCEVEANESSSSSKTRRECALKFIRRLKAEER
jgi:hypothetical protein